MLELMVSGKSTPAQDYNLEAVQMRLLRNLLGCGIRKWQWRTPMPNKTTMMRTTNIHPRALCIPDSRMQGCPGILLAQVFAQDPQQERALNLWQELHGRLPHGSL